MYSQRKTKRIVNLLILTSLMFGLFCVSIAPVYRNGSSTNFVKTKTTQAKTTDNVVAFFNEKAASSRFLIHNEEQSQLNDAMTGITNDYAVASAIDMYPAVETYKITNIQKITPPRLAELEPIYQYNDVLRAQEDKKDVTIEIKLEEVDATETVNATELDTHVAETHTTQTADTETITQSDATYVENESQLRIMGTEEGPSGHETYYNLNMSGVVSNMRKAGYTEEDGWIYWIREEDDVKMFGPYAMCAANLDIRPKGTILQTSVGPAIVCDTGEFAITDPTAVDIATNW